MTYRCAFCAVGFDDTPRSKRIERSVSIASVGEGRMNTTLSEMLSQHGDKALEVLATLAASPSNALCNYCHTRASISREAAEAL